MEMLISVTRLIEARRSDEYYKDNIWRTVTTMATDLDIEVSPPFPGRRSRIPSRY
jgi:hypothetical protein